jgi:3-hydroxybutyrate dehydrogenase
MVEKQAHDRAARSGRSSADEQTLLLAEKQALVKFTTPAQIAELAYFLCSDSAATMTAATLSIDGGWVAR